MIFISNWTHVAGIVRIDYFRFEDTPDPDFDEIFGKELDSDDDYDAWNEADKHPEKFMPLGSEGSLKKSVWINPRRHDAASYTVSVFGDLRDHESSQEIIEWFKKICSKLNVRNATITAYNYVTGTANWTYKENDDD